MPCRWPGMACASAPRPATRRFVCTNTKAVSGSNSPSAEQDIPSEQPLVTPWQRTEAMRLTRQSFLDLLDGRTPAICEPGFLSKEVSNKIVEEIGPKFTPYLHVAGPAVKRVGVAQFEFQAQSAEDFKNRGTDHKERYFQAVTENEALHDDLAAKIGDNPWQRVLARVATLVPGWDVQRASEGPGKRYFSGIYRAINDSTPIHCDWSPFDSITEDWIINRVTHQAVFNLYCAEFKGGETIVYDVQWSRVAMKHRDPATYGYFPSVVEKRKSFTFNPQQGDLCFFNSRNMHEVKSVQFEDHPLYGRWSPPRITLSSFMGLLPSEVTGGRPRLIFWS
ncbi:hypothetical protein BBP40_001327 [Aspergillus hancockii]|nr:hypothetical protein BBP40_001327 [Aspergillus hancockii]